ncbi:AraC family transcriptional regulator [Peptoniphilus porci]|nr:AraC family transcriptional regulator [Peptoniphilus porci]
MKTFNLAIDYIEDKLTEEIDEREIMKITGYSYPMFSRIFSVISGYSLSEYIRLRKMTKAANELKNSDERVIDIAFKYGYNSQDSFTLAFKNFHMVTPGQVKRGAKYQYFPRIYFSISVQGGNQMDIKIEKKKAFKVAGVKSDVTKGSNFSKVWDELIEKVPREKFDEFGSGQIYGVGYDYLMDEEDSFIYLAGFDVKDERKAKDLGLEILNIPEKEYAILSLKGSMPECIHEGWKYIISYFFPKEGYRHDESPDFEVYGNGNPTSEDYEMELWVPIVRESDYKITS